MAGDGLLIAGCLLAVAGVAVLRLSWSRPRRSVALNAVGWAGLAGASVLAGLAEGAWGVAVAAACATAVACAMLALAATERPRPARRKAASAISANTAAPGSWRRGAVTFLLAGPAALAVAVALALAARKVAVGWPLAEADANVMVLALVPLAWPLLTFAMLMVAERRMQLAMLALPLAFSLLPLLAMGHTS